MLALEVEAVDAVLAAMLLEEAWDWDTRRSIEAKKGCTTSNERKPGQANIRQSAVPLSPSLSLGKDLDTIPKRWRIRFEALAIAESSSSELKCLAPRWRTVLCNAVQGPTGGHKV